MKNNLFRKFLAVFLTGTLLGAVGCKDYDDDINDLKGQIDDLKGKIELKADASALSSLQQKLEGINFDDFVKDAELNKMVKDLGYQTAEDVKALIPEGMSTQDVKNIFDAQIKALDTWGEIESNIGKAVKEYLAGSEYTTAQQTQIINTILGQIDPTAKEIKTAIKNLAGRRVRHPDESVYDHGRFPRIAGRGRSRTPEKGERQTGRRYCRNDLFRRFPGAGRPEREIRQL